MKKSLHLIAGVVMILASLSLHANKVIDYNVLVNKAELAIVYSDLKQAMHYYDSAFNLRDKPFALDAYNATVCAVRLKQWKLAFRYANTLAELGVGKDFFNRNIYLIPLSEQKGWDRLLLKADAAMKAKAAYKPVLAVIDSLVAKDQRVNHEWRDAGRASKERQIMDLTYDTIALHLHHIFDSLGFLSEDKTGAWLSDAGNEIKFTAPYSVIILHNYQSRMKGDTLFSSVLRKAVNEGMIKPEFFAFFGDFGGREYGKVYYGSSMFFTAYKCKIYLEHSNRELQDTVDKARETLGMGTTLELLKKMIFNMRYPSSGFMIYAPISRIANFANEGSEQQMLGNSEVIIEHIPDCKE
jgi:hypothetical protein